MKKFPLVLIFGLLSIVFGCKNDKNTDEISVNGESVDKSLSSSSKGQLFDPCSLISLEKVGEIFGIDPKILALKNDQYSGDFSRSCNLKWSDPADGNTYSMLIILQSNPIQGEIDDWATSYLSSRLQNGEKSFPDNEKPIKYVKFEGIDSESAYNVESKKLYWKINKDYVMAVFMSDSFKPDKAIQYLTSLHEVLTKNILKKLK
jgi:hypothetical protein